MTDLPGLADLVGYKQMGINIWAPPTFALLALDPANKIVPSQAATNARFYYQTVDPAISREGDVMRVPTCWRRRSAYSVSSPTGPPQ